jgi:Ni,Fe-hydrogenase III large subunit/Ni,Fe-hydrogenase III component G
VTVVTEPLLPTPVGPAMRATAGAPEEWRLEVLPEATADVAAVLAGDGWRFVTLVGTDDRGGDGRGPGGGFGLEFAVERPGGPLLRIHADLDRTDPSYASISRAYPAALWDEREMKDLLGVTPEGHPDPRRLVLHEAFPPAYHPLRRDAPPQPTDPPPGSHERHYVPVVAQGEGVYQLPVGPIHAGVIEPGHFRFSAVGETVLHLDARLFYTHRGIERLVEGRSFARALPIVERSCGVCTVTHALAFSRAVERLYGIATQVPPRAARARALLAELERVYNHVGDLGNMCAGIAFNPGSSQLGWLKERLLRVNESLTGHRYLMGVVVPGGLAFDLDADALAAAPARLRALEADLRAALHLVNRSDAAVERFRGTGVIAHDLALALGTVGVAGRASGIAGDLRRERPGPEYAGLAITDVHSAAGDAAARFHVRAQEALASFELLDALLTEIDRAPADDLRALPSLTPGAGASALGWAEGPRGPSWLWLRAGPDGTVDRLRLRSASFANWPSVAAAVPGNLVPDFPLINKSFELCYACTDR